MRRPVHNAIRLAFVALLGVSTLAAAQGMIAANHNTGRMDEGITGPPPIPPGVAALVLDHAVDVGIVDSQRVALEAIRRTQDSANKPWLAKLDSLKPTSQPAGGPNDLSQEQRDEINARRVAIKQALDGMKETNAVARQQAMALLTPDQQKKAEQLENDARKRAQDETNRRNSSGYQQGMSGGRGRPPAG
jgi:hypothetical protein